ncbi:MAG: cytosine/creatinine deaminase [Pseudonocardiales bacterium]|nr:cytosine/creatinine deaminase [Pseudonocardiales bacterium]
MTAPAIGTAVAGLRGVRTAAGEAVDVLLDAAGVVTEVRPASAAPVGEGELALPGWVLLPSAVEPHAHLDKAFSWAASQAPYGDLPSAIDSWCGYARRLTAEDVDRRARHALTRYLAAGFTAVRSHVDLPLDADDPLCGVRALLGLREQLRDVLDLQVCLLASSVADTAALERALDLGVDVLGGCPHLADDPVKELTRLLDLAERRGIDVDLHTDEQLNPGMLTIRELARQVSARGLTQRVTASHCVSLGSLDPSALADVLAVVRAAGLAVVTLPITNLYLQGRESAAPVPRGLPAVRELLAAGVTVAAGGDNVRDPFNPVGRADPFETTSLLVTAAHLNAGQALHAVTDAGRTVLGLPPAGPFQGGLADLVAVQADDLTDVLAGATGSRVVLRRGRVVAATTVERHTAADLSPPTIGRSE